jgi:hypothetical protein
MIQMPALAAGQAPTLVISPSGNPHPVYVWATQSCDAEAIPDAPARAFRRADDQVALIATHYENWSLLGTSPADLKPRCGTIFSSKKASDPDLGKVWIEAVYSPDGRRVAAIGSRDMTEVMKRRGCRATGGQGACWLNDLVSLGSSDMGDTFSLGETVASFGSTYPEGEKGRLGAFTTSNIVAWEGTHVMLAWVEAPPRQARGNCLLSSRDPMDGRSWRAWNGRDFGADLALGEPCEPVSLGFLPNEVRSLSWSARHKQWIAVYSSRQKLAGDREPVPGFYYSLSPDLRSWSTPQRIMAAPTRPREQQSEFFVAYPSLIDPESRSRNFDTVDGSSPLLFYTVHRLRNGSGTLNRDLYAQPLDLR